MATEYDVIEYPHRPFSQTQPDRLAVMGTLFGMQPASPAKCRVLELGCGSGGNLIPLADLSPESTFLGLDLAQTAIDAGQIRVDKLGLRNIRLQQMDVMEFPADAGEFDYIIAHGLISWVPEPVRGKILEICEKHLAPQGIAYISYNAYPGCYMRRMWREMMLFHTQQFSNPADKIQQAKGILQLVAHGTTREDAAHHLAKEEFKKRLETPDASLFHDDLSPFWQPYYFHEFASLAGRHGMQYLAEAAYPDMQPTGLTEQALAALRSVERAGIVMYEQYLDFFKVRRFRQTLLCRQDVALQRPVDVSRMEKFHYSGPIQMVPVKDENAPPDTRAFKNGINDVTVTTNNPVSVGALTALAHAWPASKSFDELAAVSGDRSILAQALHTFYSTSFFNVHAVPRTGARVAGEKPEVWRVSRLEASMDAAVPHLQHGSIELADEGTRRLVTLLDGTRTREDVEEFAGGRLKLEETLHKMARAGILVA